MLIDCVGLEAEDFSSQTEEGFLKAIIDEGLPSGATFQNWRNIPRFSPHRVTASMLVVSAKEMKELDWPHTLTKLNNTASLLYRHGMFQMSSRTCIFEVGTRLIHYLVIREDLAYHAIALCCSPVLRQDRTA